VCSVPHGSILVLLLFVLYVADLVNVVEKHGLRLYVYADDSQLTLHFRRDEVGASIERLERCIDDVDQWMSTKRLMLNVDRTEWLLVGSRHSLSSLNITRPVLQVGGNTIAASDHVRLLEDDIVPDLSLDQHVTNVSASCFYRLRQMRRIRRSLDNHSAITLVHALVSTGVDYCNSVLAAAPKMTTDKLQHVLNAAARVVSNTYKFDRSLLQLLHGDLHWLDVPDRVAFKLIVTVYRCLNDRAPNYLSNHVIPVSAVSRQRLRSAQQNTLVVQCYRLTAYGRRAFSVARPTAWYTLPVAFRDPTISDTCCKAACNMIDLSIYQRDNEMICM